MAETDQDKIARLEKRIARLKKNMLDDDSRPRLIAGAAAMQEARVNREFAEVFLAVLDKGSERTVDLKSITEFVVEIEEKWQLQNRASLPEGWARTADNTA
ncbi:MAG: hypothetical protein JJU24_10510 [Natronohydrobacter sp.]|nr:hypothetical protein [Natronohydrobacter sp.]